YDLLESFSKAASRSRDARCPGGCGEKSPVGTPRFPRLTQVHQVRQLYEHMPGVPEGRRTQLSQHHHRSDRSDSRAKPGYETARRSSFCVNAVWLVLECMPREDQHPRSAV